MPESRDGILYQLDPTLCALAWQAALRSAKADRRVALVIDNMEMLWEDDPAVQKAKTVWVINGGYLRIVVHGVTTWEGVMVAKTIGLYPKPA